MPDNLRVETRFKNAVLYRAMERACGSMAHTLHDGAVGPPPLLRTSAEVCGVPVGFLSGILALKISPWFTAKNQDRTGKRKPAAERISECLGVPFDELFPRSLYALNLPSVVVREFDSERVLSLQEAAASHLLPAISTDPNVPIIAAERKRILGSMIDTLTERQAKVIKMRFGMDPYDREHSLDEVGKVLGVSRERVRSIEGQSLLRMRHPERSHRVIELIGTQ